MRETLGHGFWLFHYIFQTMGIYKLNVIQYCYCKCNYPLNP